MKKFQYFLTLWIQGVTYRRTTWLCICAPYLLQVSQSLSHQRKTQAWFRGIWEWLLIKTIYSSLIANSSHLAHSRPGWNPTWVNLVFNPCSLTSGLLLQLRVLPWRHPAQSRPSSPRLLPRHTKASHSTLPIGAWRCSQCSAGAWEQTLQ